MRKTLAMATACLLATVLFGCMGGGYKQSFIGSFFEIGHPDDFAPKNTQEGLYLEGPFKILISAKLLESCKEGDTNSLMVVADSYGKDFWASQQVLFGHPAVMLRSVTEKGTLMGCYVPFNGAFAYAMTLGTVEDEKTAENIFGTFDVTSGEDVLLYAKEVEKSGKGPEKPSSNSKEISEQIESVLKGELNKLAPGSENIEAMKRGLEKTLRAIDLKKEFEKKDSR